jgi:hypothetical protein
MKHFCRAYTIDDVNAETVFPTGINIGGQSLTCGGTDTDRFELMVTIGIRFGALFFILLLLVFKYLAIEGGIPK